MFVMLVVAAAAAQPVMIAQSTLPPPITVVPSPPPVLRSAPMRGDYSAVPAVAAFPVRVRVVAGPQVLFNDSLRIARNASASYQESRNEAPEAICPGERYYSSQERYSLNINLYSRDDNSAGPAVNVSVSWTRPARAVTCGEGTRQVQLTQTVPLTPGQSVTLQGDAGLTVTLSR